jgi:hypothetical protein
MKSYIVTRKVEFTYYVDANSKDEAIAIVEDMGESQASISGTEFTAKVITDKMVGNLVKFNNS